MFSPILGPIRDLWEQHRPWTLLKEAMGLEGRDSGRDLLGLVGQGFPNASFQNQVSEEHAFLHRGNMVAETQTLLDARSKALD